MCFCRSDPCADRIRQWAFRLLDPHLLHPPRPSGIQNAYVPGDPLGDIAALAGAIGLDDHDPDLENYSGASYDPNYELG